MADWPIKINGMPDSDTPIVLITLDNKQRGVQVYSPLPSRLALTALREAWLRLDSEITNRERGRVRDA